MAFLKHLKPPTASTQTVTHGVAAKHSWRTELTQDLNLQPPGY